MPRSPIRLALPLLVLAATALTAAPAGAAAPSCSRGGAKVLAADGDTRVVSLRVRPRHQETRRDVVMGCRVPTGRRFVLFLRRTFGLDSIERNRFTIVDGRYIGVVRHFEGGVSESRSAQVWDARTRRRLHDSRRCDVGRGDLTGIDDVAFLPGGGMAYSCNALRIADAAGDRELEPVGTDVRNLAVSIETTWYRPRLYWLVVSGATQEVRSLELAS